MNVRLTKKSLILSFILISSSFQFLFSQTAAVTIVASGGVTNTWTYANNTISPNSSTPVILNASDVLTRLATGNLTISGTTITIDADLINSTNLYNLTFKASQNITVNASKTVSNNSGKLIFWADSDANNDGVISLLASANIQSNGGDLILAGGLDDGSNSGVANDGVPDGYAKGGSGISGISTTGSFTINSGSGNILLRGASTNRDGVFLSASTSGQINSANGRLDIFGRVDPFGSTVTSSSGVQTGIRTHGGGVITIDGGSGIVNINGDAPRSGIGFGIDDSGSYGSDNTTQTIVKSSNNTASAITLKGSGANNAGSHGVSLRGANIKIYATQALGGITIDAISPNWSSAIYSPLEILAVSGPIKWLNSDATYGIYSATVPITIGSKAGVNGLTASNSDITVNLKLLSGTPALAIGTTGDVVIQGVNGTAAFGQAFSSSTFGFNANSQIASSVTFGSSSNNQNITLDQNLNINGPITVYGSAINVNGSLTTSGTSNKVLLKATGTISVTADITTDGGDITLWADADNNNSGGIRIDDNVDLDSRTQADRTGNTHTTGGGNITLAGGLDDAGSASGTGTLTSGLTANDNYPDGYAVNSGSTVTQTGIVLGTSTSATGHNSNINIFSGSGNIRLHGLVTNNSSNTTNGPTGLLFFHGYTINAGASGNVTLLGNANLTSGAHSAGMDLAAWREASYTASGTVRALNGNISVIGRASGGTSSNVAMAIDGNGVKRNIFAATGSGTISFNGLATGNGISDIRLTNSDILAANGTITLTAGGTSGVAIGGYNIGDGLFLGQKAGSLVTTSTSNLLIRSNELSTVNKPIAFNTSGTVTIESLGANFASAQTIGNVTFANTISALTIGKTTNTSNITIGSAATIAGPITIYGGDITIAENLNTSSGNANGDILVKARGSIIQDASKTITTNNADIVFWTDADANNGGAITIGDNAVINTANGSTSSGLTGGGNIILAGGLDDGANGGVATDGIPDGFAINASGNGIKLGTTTAAHTQMYSGGGNIILRGRSTRTIGSGIDLINNVGVFQYGKWTANSGKGAIIINGTAAGYYGINFVEPGANNISTGDKYLALTSDKSSGDAISITGTSSNDYGVVFNYNNPKEILATGGGNVTISGTAGSNFGIFLQNQDILATSGTISLNGGTRGIRVTSNGARFGSKTGTQITNSAANVLLSGDVLTIDALSSGFVTSVISTGSFTLEPSGTSFSSAVTLPNSNLTLGAGISGLTIGKTSNATDITIGSSTAIAGPITVYGRNIMVDNNINTTAGSAAGDILLKARGNIIQNSNRTITTNGGSVVLWSDSDASGTATSAGGTISLLASSAINTSGGNIALAGGSDANNDGLPDGYAIGAYTMTDRGASPASAGLSLDNASINAGAGEVLLRGQGTGSAQNFQIGTRLYGGSINGGDIKVEARGSIQGTSSSNWGLSLEGFSIIGSGNIILNGWGGRAGALNADANQVGVEIRSALDNTSKHSEIKSTGSGTITINGVGGAGTFADPAVTNPQAVGIRIVSNQANPINSANGSITLNGTSGYSGRGSAIIVSSPISSTNGNIILKGNPSTAGTLNLNGNIEINSTLTTGAEINLETPGAVTQTAAITANDLALIGSGSFTLTNTSNNVATIAGGDNTTKLGNLSFTDASGGLTIGTVGSKSGVTSTGTILVESLAGDITLSQNLNTTNTTSSAITVNAGKSSAIGTTTGGNIVVSGTPTVTTGTGGVSKLFSGSDGSSTGLTSLVGGSANTRSAVDETTTTFTPALSSGVYALYRASNATAPSITSFTPEIAGNGETVTITGTGFTGTTAVKFGNINATSFTVISDTEISAIVSTGASGSVQVTNPAGAVSKTGFIYKIVHYQFENNTLDKTDANLDATLVGAASYENGPSGKAICFSNTYTTGATVSNFLSMPSNLIRSSSTFTISLRFKTSTYGAILAYQNGAVGTNVNNWVPILYVRQDGRLSSNLWIGTTLNVTTANRVDDGVWHKVEFSVTPGSISIYLDGVSVGSSSGTINHLDMSINQLGASKIQNAAAWPGMPAGMDWVGFNGCIDEFYIFEKALTASEIQQATQLPQPTIASFTPTTAKSGETVTITGTNLDGTSNVKIGGVDARSITIVSATEIKAVVGKNASINNNVSVTTAAGTVSSTGFTFSCSSNALDFDGSNDYVLIGDKVENLGAFTAEAWVYWKGSTQDFSEIYSKDLINSFSITSGNKMHANFGNGSTWGNGVNSATSIPLNTWTHLAITRNASGAVKLYINGELDVNTVTNSLTGSNAINRGIGVKPYSGGYLGYFKGSIDELRVWNVERTAQQIADNLGSEFVGNETGLIAYYNFNQGTAAGNNASLTTLNDLTTAAANPGTVTNAALSGSTSNFILGYWPLIRVQPIASINVCKNATAGNTVSVTALGNQLTYQWYSNTSNSNTGGTAISNANAATFTIPTATSGTTYYYVVVSNGCNAGSTTSSVVAATVNELPTVSYANATYSYLNGEAITTVTPTGSGASSFSISPVLPAGLSFNTSTGAISGTPTTASTATTYTVTATASSTCTATTSFTLNVFNAVAPSAMSFSPATQNVLQNVTISNMVPSASGGTIVNYTISPALPAGLIINPTTGVISGTLTTTVGGSVQYTITATNTGGSTTSTITLVYNTAPTNLAVSPSAVNENSVSGSVVGILTATDADVNDTHSFTLVSGTGSTDNSSFTIDGNTLKTAAVFDFETKSSYTIRVKATDAGGLSYEKAITITINDLDNEDTDGDGIEDGVEKGSDPANPIDTDGDGIPDFKDLDADGDGVPDATEVVDGTDYLDKTKYKDTDGDMVPDYVETQNGTSPNDAKSYKDTDGDGVPDYVELLDGTDPNSASSFKDTDGGGVPDYVETRLYPLYGLTAGNSILAADDNRDTDGDGISDYAEIKAGTNPNDAPANLKYVPSSLIAEKGTAITAIIPGFEKGKPLSYSISPALPAGLTFNATTGVISGTPTVLQTTAVVYTITATNNGGSTTTNFTLKVNDIPPSALKLSPASQLSEQGKAIATMTPSSNGGPVVSYSIAPALPAGLTMNTTTGVISGTRTQALTGTVSYTVTATNSGGSTTSTVTFTYNTTPTDIAVSKANIYEGNAVGDVIGTLSTTDIDNPEIFTYTIVAAGTNIYDNKNFKISGNRLLADTTFNFDFKNSYQVRVRTTDSQGLFSEKVFTISISKRPVIYGTSSSAYITSTFTGTSNISTTPVISKGYSSQLSIVGSDIASVSWSTGTGLSSTTSLTPVFKNGTSVTYNVTITNTFGSVVVLPFTVEVRDDYFLKPTNIITTRQDGINDYFVVENIQNYPDNEVTIYDRNGKVLTKLNNYNNRWDGKINGNYLSNDTYYYVIRFTSNPKVVVKGFITLINN